jgi:aarF domain-containing kinase
LVLLDHGLYRIFDEHFRKLYCDLWVGILKMDDQLLQDVGTQLGPTASQYWKYFPLMFAGHPHGSATTTALGDTISEEERQKLRANIQLFRLEQAMEFLEGLPRDMLLAMRTMNLVSGVHRTLGGTNLPKFKTQAWYAILGRNLRLVSPSASSWLPNVSWYKIQINGGHHETVVHSLRLTSWIHDLTIVWWRLWCVTRLSLLQNWLSPYVSQVLRTLRLTA